MKKRVAILFGGRSAEHEVSLQSARHIIDAIDQEKYETVLIGIDRQGAWYVNDQSVPLLNTSDPKLIELNKGSAPVSLIASERKGVLVNPDTSQNISSIDVIFPVLHGPYGEDGSVQGLAKLANVPCVGSDILGSAIGMDKDVCKRLLRDAGIPIADYVCVRRNSSDQRLLQQVNERLGFPVYVKPANMGSSVGVSKVSEPAQLLSALENAFQYDTKVLVEAQVLGREIECAVLGNDAPVASEIGEIVTDDGFYSYEKKYIDEKGAVLQIPAELDAQTKQKAQQMAIKAFTVLEGRGLARVDMFLVDDDQSNPAQLIVNEINTIPGFTAISMYPKLWQQSGIPYGELIDRLIELAMEEHDMKSKLLTTGH